MPSFPSWCKYSWRDMSDSAEPVVERTQMERGIPKQRRIASDAQQLLAFTVFFDTKAEANSFETWFFNDLQAGALFFDFTHPRLGTVVQGRVVGGKLGELQYQNRTLEKSSRTLSIEWWRSTWP